MQTKLLSNRFLVAAITLLSLSACMQEQVEKNYRSNVEGYERRVVEERYKEQKQKIAAVAAPQIQAAVPVIMSNPYAFGQSLGMAPSNNAYGSLNNETIQSGVFMQNNMPVYQPQNYYGNTYSPTTRY